LKRKEKKKSARMCEEMRQMRNNLTQQPRNMAHSPKMKSCVSERAKAIEKRTGERKIKIKIKIETENQQAHVQENKVTADCADQANSSHIYLFP